MELSLPFFQPALHPDCSSSPSRCFTFAPARAELSCWRDVTSLLAGQGHLYSSCRRLPRTWWEKLPFGRCQQRKTRRMERVRAWVRLAFLKASWPTFPTFPTLITSARGLGSRSLCPWALPACERAQLDFISLFDLETRIKRQVVHSKRFALVSASLCFPGGMTLKNAIIRFAWSPCFEFGCVKTTVLALFMVTLSSSLVKWARTYVSETCLLLLSCRFLQIACCSFSLQKLKRTAGDEAFKINYCGAPKIETVFSALTVAIDRCSSLQCLLDFPEVFLWHVIKHDFLSHSPYLPLPPKSVSHSVVSNSLQFHGL